MDTTNSSEKPQRRVKHGQRPTEPLADWPAEFGAAGAEQPAATSGDAPADLQQLKALALAATPGPWLATHWNGHAPTTVMRAGTTMAIAETAGFGRNSSECAPDAAYIAAANPAVVLDLIARIERAAAPATASGDELPELPAPLEVVWPELHRQGLGCGVEDRNITDRYDAAEYGWECGVERAIECVPELLYEEATVLEIQREAYELGKARVAVSAATKPTADLPDENECWVHIYPSDLKRMERTETHANVFSVAVGRAGEVSVPLYTAEQVQSLLATKPAAAPAVAEGWMLVPKMFVTEVRRAAEIADSYSPSIDSIDEHGGEECEEPIWQIHHILYYAHAKLFGSRAATPAASTTGAAQTAEQVRGDQA